MEGRGLCPGEGPVSRGGACMVVEVSSVHLSCGHITSASSCAHGVSLFVNYK